VRRALLDTSIYVDWFRARRHEEIVAGREGPPSLSAVVAMELLAGSREARAVERLVAEFQRRGRLVQPGWQTWRRAARVLRELHAGGGSASSLLGDVLVAMTARVEGLRLFTTNRRDFERIAAIEPFDLTIVG
jgi:predicted nucleic acid-binding protein